MRLISPVASLVDPDGRVALVIKDEHNKYDVIEFTAERFEHACEAWYEADCPPWVRYDPDTNTVEFLSEEELSKLPVFGGVDTIPAP